MKRSPGIDVARAFAVLAMIQTHAYDAWVAPHAKASAAYAFTRVLATLPLPAFMLLAGTGVAMRLIAGERRGESAASARHAILSRAFRLFLVAYATNAAYALIDGWNGVGTFLRVDVLHAIALSLVAVTAIATAGMERIELRRCARRAAIFGLLVAVACPFVTVLSRETPLPAGYVVGLFAEVPNVTRMPVVPLASWLALGVCVTFVERKDALAVGALFAVVVGAYGTSLLRRALPQTYDRAHPAIYANVVDLAGRAMLVLSAGLAIAPRLERRAPRVEKALVTLGRGSLVAYVFHIPLCYGRLGAPMKGALDMTRATMALGVLVVLSFTAVLLFDAVARRVKGPTH